MLGRRKNCGRECAGGGDQPRGEVEGSARGKGRMVVARNGKERQMEFLPTLTRAIRRGHLREALNEAISRADVLTGTEA